MDEKEKVHAYLEMHKTQRDSFNKRRDIEWKVNIAFWGGIFVVSSFLTGIHVQMHTTDLLLYGTLWFVYSFLWTSGHWYQNETDSRWALFYLAHAECLLGLGEEPQKPEKPPKLGFLSNWSRCSQIIATAVLLFLSWAWLNRVQVK